MPTVCIEGVPGAGKNALAVYLTKKFKSIKYHTYAVCPSDLSDVQADSQRWSFCMQLRVLLDRCLMLQECWTGDHVLVGSPHTDIKCHAAMSVMHDAERALYDLWAEQLTRCLPKTQHVLIDVTPEQAWANLINDSRREEAHITLHSLSELSAKFREVVIVDVCLSFPSAANENEFLLQPAAERVANVFNASYQL